MKALSQSIHAVIATLSASKCKERGSEATRGVTCECTHVREYSLGVPDSGDSVVSGCVKHTHWPAESSAGSPISSKQTWTVWPVACPPVRKVMNDHEGKTVFEPKKKNNREDFNFTQLLPTTPKLKSQLKKTLEVGHR